MWVDQALYKEDMEYILQSKSFDWNRIKNSTILVTGGTGLIGSTLINSLVYAVSYTHLTLPTTSRV